jgi:hypothetical protein
VYCFSPTHGSPTFFLIGNRPCPLLLAGLKAVRGQNDCVNYCEWAGIAQSV